MVMEKVVNAYIFFSLLLYSITLYPVDALYKFLKDTSSQHNFALYDRLADKGASAFAQGSVIDEVTAQRLFVIHNEGYNLWQTLFSKTITQSGEGISKRLLLAPLGNASLIKKRQELLRYLTQEQKRIFVKTQLQAIAQYEATFLGLRSDSAALLDRKIDELLSPLLFIKNDISPSVTSVYQWFSRTCSIVSPILSNLVYRGAAAGVGTALKKQGKDFLQEVWKGVKERCTDFGFTCYSIINPYQFKEDLYKKQKELSPFWGSLYKAWTTGEDIFFLYDAYKRDKVRGQHIKRVLDLAQNSITTVRNMLSCVKALYGHFCQNNGIESAPESLVNIGTMLNNKNVQKFYELAYTLEHEGVLKSGYIIAAYRALRQAKYDLLPLLAFIGELDTYCVLAELLIISENDASQPYSLVSIDDTQTKPYLWLKDFHNPLIENNRAVNTITLESQGGHVLLEGPHASGKSTITRAIAYNFILMHTFGIIAAREGKGTLFDKFISYSNVHEIPQKKLSGFDAQLHEMVALRQTIEEYEQAHKRVFCFLDEPLTGTMEEAGAQELKRFCTFMATTKNVCCLLATHFNNVTSDDAFKPYYLECDEEDGVFTRTYLMKEGRHPWWYTDRTKREKYIVWMTEKARENILSKYKSFSPVEINL